MKQILSLFILLILFTSCSDNDTIELTNNGIDSSILGKWKVQYSKTIKGAKFLENGNLEISDGALFSEYNGDYEENLLAVKSGMFDDKEVRISINQEGKIYTYMESLNEPKDVAYKIRNGYLVCYDILQYRYLLKGGKLMIERIPIKENSWTYTVSIYKKILE